MRHSQFAIRMSTNMSFPTCTKDSHEVVTMAVDRDDTLPPSIGDCPLQVEGYSTGRMYPLCLEEVFTEEDSIRPACARTLRTAWFCPTPLAFPRVPTVVIKQSALLLVPLAITVPNTHRSPQKRARPDRAFLTAPNRPSFPFLSSELCLSPLPFPSQAYT